mmetsp:Transcript_103124/g.298321  ORF Transcript_103124/g.298321 Transcript_103124/m.298321 type:complete len:253 (+) Transcript_103124:1649-2407(+)
MRYKAALPSESSCSGTTFAGKPAGAVPLPASSKWCSRNASKRNSASISSTPQSVAATPTPKLECSRANDGRQRRSASGRTATAASRTVAHGRNTCNRLASSSIASNMRLGSVRGNCATSHRAQTQMAMGNRPQRCTSLGPCSSRKAAASGKTLQRQRRRRTASSAESSPTSTMPSDGSWSPPATPVDTAASSFCTGAPIGPRTGVRAVMSTCKCGFSFRTVESQWMNALRHFWYKPWHPSKMSKRYPGKERR